MIKLLNVHIEEIRGIRKLDIEFDETSFAISGPNGSGKSGVIDAIEFGLTGRMSRLAGTGTQGLSVADHGPHVDRTNFPEAAFVRIDVHLTEIDKRATITRTLTSPKKPTITPADADIKAAFAEISNHPEITLSRREILRFILVEASTRSQEIQALLKMDGIGAARAALHSAENKILNQKNNADVQLRSAEIAFQRHLQTETLQSADILESINVRRSILDLPILDRIESDHKFHADLEPTVVYSEFNKASSLRDIDAFLRMIGEIHAPVSEHVASIHSTLDELEKDSGLQIALKRHDLKESGLALVDGPECPLCETEWTSAGDLRLRISETLTKSKVANELRTRLLGSGAELMESLTRVTSHAKLLENLARKLGDETVAERFVLWVAGLEHLRAALNDVPTLHEKRALLKINPCEPARDILDGLETLRENILARPDQTALSEAVTFLHIAQERRNDIVARTGTAALASRAARCASAAYETYCRIMEEQLDTLYRTVQDDFSAFYRSINADDEGGFSAKLTPSEGKLTLDVNFYDRGLFPPGAYHSEGHQDGMGVCLYLALMRNLYGKRFSLALLDDVVMSVDTGHRRKFCKLLKAEFPETQFIVTTHDRVWAEQMKSAGLVSKKKSLAFHAWTVDGGPLVESDVDVWDKIDAQLTRGEVDSAAAALRNHLEYVSRFLADQLRANVPFSNDGDYDLGTLLPNVVSQLGKLHGKAASSAQSWSNESAREIVAARKAELARASNATSVEQWAVNRAVHYNQWANFGRTDFKPVVAAFKELLACFRCTSCGWLFVSPRVSADSLRCDCGQISLNLLMKT